MNAPAQQAAPAESKPPAPPQLVPQRMLGSEYARNIWVVTVEHGITREQFLQPAFWSLCAARLKPYDHVEVRCDDGTYWAELLVLDSSRTWARVRELRYVSLNTSDVAWSAAKLSGPKRMSYWRCLQVHSRLTYTRM